MSNFQDLDIVLFRDSLSRPWGFRMQGGADFNFPLTIQRVFSGSPAERDLLRGDVILAFDGYDVGRLTHKQAQDVVRVAGGQLKIRVRRPFFGNPRPVTSSSVPIVLSNRPKSTSPRSDPASSYFASHDPPKPNWHPVRGPGMGDFGVQYGPKSPGSGGGGVTFKRTLSSPTGARNHSPSQEADLALQRMQDSLTKLTMNNESDEIDYSFMKKSVRERKKAFMQETPADYRPRAASCQPHLRHGNYSNLMTSSYTEPSYSSSHQDHHMTSSSYAAPPSHHRPAAVFTSKSSSLPRRPDFGWSPSKEKMAAARRAPHPSAASQMQHSVFTEHDDDDGRVDADEWMGGGDSGWGRQPLIRSSSVSVLHEAPTRHAVSRPVASTPHHHWDRQRPVAVGGQFREVGRWHMETHSQPSTKKKFSTSATIRVGGRGDPQPARVVRRFSASNSPFDGTMSLDRRHPEPLKITIGSSWNADYHPAYPANVLGPPPSTPGQKMAAREIQHHISRVQAKQPTRQHHGPTAASHGVGARSGPKPRSKPQAGTYRPLQQSYSTPAAPRWDDPDYMSSDF